MLARLTITASLVFAACANAEPTRVNMGDGQIDGTNIQPYELTWQQCSVQDGAWINGGPLTESAVVIGDHILRVRQTTTDASGQQAAATTYFDRATLSPLHMENRFTGPDGTELALISRLLGTDGHVSTMKQQGETVSKPGIVDTSQYHGGALGLPLTTLDHAAGSFALDASMIGFDATYSVITIPAGTETVTFDGEEVELMLVDIEWHHNELGDVYPPGPDATGGRYWLALNPPEGFPRVSRYQTDTYAIEFQRDVCPAPPTDNEE